MWPFLTAVAAVAGVGVGWLTRRRQVAVLRENVDWTGEDLAARKATDLVRDLVENRRRETPEPPRFMQIRRGVWGPPETETEEEIRVGER